MVSQPLGSSRPRRRAAVLALVWLGGAAGTATRASISTATPGPGAIFMINITGSLLLGVLLEGLARGGPDAGRRQLVRLTLGTGFLGGFTTYSALTVDTVTLVGHGRPGAAAAYALGTLVIGAGAGIAGIVMARLLRRRTR